MIAILRKSDRELLAVVDTIAEAAIVRKGRESETIVEIVGVASFQPRIVR